MVGHKTTIILFLVCIQIYLSIQAVIQPADILGDDSDRENQKHNKIDKVKNLWQIWEYLYLYIYIYNIYIFEAQSNWQGK